MPDRSHLAAGAPDTLVIGVEESIIVRPIAGGDRTHGMAGHDTSGDGPGVTSRTRAAMSSPEDFRAEEGESMQTTEGTLELSLLPYAIVRIDSV